ncbi:plasmolipin [Acanthochromis polyacanthus]|uniref:Plasmolipin n=1 Tax=Acanthochromis polyacanthus TaxID=80966 RepID=A0A3Q1ESU3_9TELE|nr:plasmolipin [Acanthochromis polyacanthus]
MADFPSEVTTETSVPQPQSSTSGRMVTSIGSVIDTSFIRSIPAILMIVEILAGMIQWALIASTAFTLEPAYGWVMFVAIGFWITTTILFVMSLCAVQQKMTFVAWPLAEMMYNGIATVLYFVAFVVNAVYVNAFVHLYFGHLAAAAAFGVVVTLAYGISAFFSFLSWREGNVAPGTVPT